jgi:hypothetical protein
VLPEGIDAMPGVKQAIVMQVLAAFPIRMSPTAQPVLCNQNSLHAVGYLC